MATAIRDQRNRASRRGGARRGSASAESLPVKGTAEGSDAGDCSPAGEPQQLLVRALFGEASEQAKDTGKDVAGQSAPKAIPAATRSVLQRLPTPSRSGLAPTPAAVEPAAKGPEPWGLAATSTPTASADEKNGGYREWLQSRGQQAMQRVRKPVGGAQSPPIPPPAAAPTGLLEALQIPAPPQAVPWSPPSTNETQMQQQQWFGTNSLDMSQILNGQQSAMAYNGYQQGPPTPAAGQQSPMSYFGCQQGSTTPVSDQQQSMSFFSCQPGSGTPVSGQQSPMGFNGCQDQHSQVSFFGCQQGSATPMSGGQQQTPMSFFGCQQGSTTPMGDQPTSAAFFGCQQGAATPVSGQQAEMTYTAGQQQAPSGQQELMATLEAMMPGAFALGRDSIAEQLQNAANCCYED